MSRTTSRLLVSRQVACNAELMAQFPPFVLVSFPDSEFQDRDVLLLTPAEARELVDRLPELPIVLLWRDEPETVPVALQEHPRLVAVLDRNCHGDTVLAALRTALALAARLQAEIHDAQRLERVLEVGRALASEKDLDSLLSLILEQARALTHADGASIYTRDRDGKLYFRLWQNSSISNSAGTERRPVGEDSVAGYVARTGETVVLDDAYTVATSAPYHFNPAFDRATGYRTQSLLTVPLTNKANEVVGVLQLVNRKFDGQDTLDGTDGVSGRVRSFDSADGAIAMALAGQAGVALENSQLYGDIERLFEGFIRASVAAIEARDPTTAGHSFRVADFTERLAVAVDRSGEAGLQQVRFSRDELRELRYAALLHDFGKVGVREEVLVKAKKLYPHQLEQVQQRFRYARLRLTWHHYQPLFDALNQGSTDAEAFRARRQMVEQQVAEEHQRLERYLQTILRANEPNVLHASAPDELREILAYHFNDEEGPVPLLQDFEFSGLSLPKGSLTSEERQEIESHVSHTYSFLSLIPWTRDLARLPEIAYAHHEKIDGSGYPRGLVQQEIPVQSRMMAISDIYDALTAPDRPYKLAVPPERALSILEAEARNRKIDEMLLKVFIESGAWQLPS